MFIHHTRYTVESEPVELVFFYPEAKVAKKESQDFMVSVIEEATIPKFVAPFSAFMEIKMVRPVKFVDSIEDVFTRV